MDGCARHLSEYFILLVSNAHQLLNKAIWKVPTQHVRYQQRLLERAPKSSKHTANKLINKSHIWRQGEWLVAMDTEREKEWKMHKYGESVKKNKQKKKK